MKFYLNKDSEHGFTIVELLIVIVVIAILAAISIVAYNGIQARALDSSMKADLANAAKKFELYNAELGEYPDTAVEQTTMKISFSFSPAGTDVFPCVTATGSAAGFAIFAQRSGRKWMVQSGQAPKELTPTPVGWATGPNLCTTITPATYAQGSWGSQWVNGG